jgi:hypothetical protein
MLLSSRIPLLGLVAVVALLAVPPADAQTTAAPAVDQKEAGANVLLTVRIGRLEGARRVMLKSYDLVVVTGGRPSQLLSGARVPIPTTRRKSPEAGGEEKTDVTAFSYQNVGFSVTAEARLVEDGKILLLATLEDSRLSEESGDDPPVVETRQLSANAILEHGVPLEVTRVEGERNEAGFVEIEARIAGRDD